SGLMLAAHWGGLRVRDRGYVAIGEGLAVIGGATLLLGIALIGQIYHLSRRPADAVELWWLLPLPAAFALPSLAVGALAYAGIVVWFIMQATDRGTLLGGAVLQAPLLWGAAYGALGLVLLGLGMLHGDGAYRRLRQLLEQAGIALTLTVFIVLGIPFYRELNLDSCRCASVAIAGWTLLGVAALLIGARRPARAPPGRP